MTELSEYVTINFICLAALGVLGLRRLVRMERLHRPRVVILTVLLWVPAVYLFLLAYAPPPDYFEYTPGDGHPDGFTISE